MTVAEAYVNVSLFPPPDKIALKPWQRNLMVLNSLIQVLWNDQPWKTELQADCAGPVESVWAGGFSHGCYHLFSHGLQPLLLSLVISESPLGTLCLTGQAETRMFTEDEAAALSIWKQAMSFLQDVMFFLIFDVSTLRQMVELANAAVILLLCSWACVPCGHTSCEEKQWLLDLRFLCQVWSPN